MSDVANLAEERAMRTMNAAMKLFVVEYSVRENAVMIRTLENVVKDNIKNVKKGQIKDQLPVGFFDSRAEADRFHYQFKLIIAGQDELSFESRDWKRIGECLEQTLEARLRIL